MDILIRQVGNGYIIEPVIGGRPISEDALVFKNSELSSDLLPAAAELLEQSEPATPNMAMPPGMGSGGPVIMPPQ